MYSKISKEELKDYLKMKHISFEEYKTSKNKKNIYNNACNYYYQRDKKMEEECYELLAMSGVPFAPDGTPLGI